MKYRIIKTNDISNTKAHRDAFLDIYDNNEIFKNCCFDYATHNHYGPNALEYKFVKLYSKSANKIRKNGFSFHENEDIIDLLRLVYKTWFIDLSRYSKEEIKTFMYTWVDAIDYFHKIIYISNERFFCENIRYHPSVLLFLNNLDKEKAPQEG